MSLKAFHLVFIAASILLAAGYAVWSFNEFRQGREPVEAVGGVAALIIMLGLLGYLGRFLRKFKGVQNL